MPSKKSEPEKPEKHETVARGRRVPIDELMALPETVRRSEGGYPFPPVRSSQRLGMEAAWLEWSRTMRDLDPRTLLLLRAAFQAGYKAGRQ